MATKAHLDFNVVLLRQQVLVHARLAKQVALGARHGLVGLLQAHAARREIFDRLGAETLRDGAWF